MFSYVASNVLSSGDFEAETVFWALPEDQAERHAYRDLLATLESESARFVVISREVYPEDDSEDGEVELSVIVRPSATWLADMLAWTQATREDQYGTEFTRYNSETSDFYVSRNGVSVHVSDRYTVDIHNVSAVRLAVIEGAK